jgi:hypothetical protein
MPRAQRLSGNYRVFDRVLDDEEPDEDTIFVGYETEIVDARRIELDDGRVAFVFEHMIDADTEWEGRFESRSPGGRRFTGEMSSPGWAPYRVDATLWSSPEQDEWLLLGRYVDPDDGEEYDVAFTFWPTEDD